MSVRLGLIAVVAAFNWTCLGPMKIEQPLPQSFAELATVKEISVVADGGAVLMKGTFSDPQADPKGKLTRSATLTNPIPSGPAGTATIEIDKSSGLTEEEIEIKLTNMPFPTNCRVMVDGKELTLFATMQKGKMNLELRRRVIPTVGK